MLSIRAGFELCRLVMQRVAAVLITVLAMAVVGYVAFCALGLTPWPELAIGIDGEVVRIGPPLAFLVAALMLSLVFFLPSHARVMALETSHRQFHMGMRDVARAYALAHAADRTGAFTLQSEFDSVRERIAFLRAHPDLSSLEPEVLEVAAQMSHVSRELADIYSDRNLARARDFLTARQQEIETFHERLTVARATMDDLRPWVAQVQSEEVLAKREYQRLTEDLRILLPELWGDDVDSVEIARTLTVPDQDRPDTRLQVQGPAVLPGTGHYPFVGLHAAE